MKKTIAGLFACFVVASPVAAAPMVTWTATGEVTEIWNGALFVTPPLGTPVSVTVTFAPDQAEPHFSGKPGCMVVDLSASLTIGGYTWTGGGLGFTHANLPEDSCSSRSSRTEFSLFPMTPPPDHPYVPAIP